MRAYLVSFALIGAAVFAACDSGTVPAPSATRPCSTSAAAGACGDASATRVPAATAAPTLNATPVASTTAVPDSTATAAPSGESGIEGRVTIGPTCPVQRIDSPCPDRPYEATIAVLDGAGRPIAETHSGTDGRFRVSLPPGVYTLRPQHGAAPPTAADQTVTVTLGSFMNVQIIFDSGIR